MQNLAHFAILTCPPHPPFPRGFRPFFAPFSCAFRAFSLSFVSFSVAFRAGNPLRVLSNKTITGRLQVRFLFMLCDFLFGCRCHFRIISVIFFRTNVEVVLCFGFFGGEMNEKMAQAYLDPGTFARKISAFSLENCGIYPLFFQSQSKIQTLFS
jgi:hypothetical protein